MNARAATLFVTPMDEDGARAILGWRYDGPYAFYDACSESVDDDVRESMDGSQFAVRDESAALVGFFAYGSCAQVPGGHRAGAYEDAGALDIGLGLRPDLTGKGLGLGFVGASLKFGVSQFQARTLRLSVATFNRRAITVCERAGFRVGGTFFSPTPHGDAEFLVMTRND